MTTNREFTVLWYDDASDEEVVATLAVNVTDEGVIVDVIDEGEVVATWGATAQELASDYVR